MELNGIFLKTIEAIFEKEENNNKTLTNLKKNI